MDPNDYTQLTPDEYADQILGECEHDDSVDLESCESLDDTVYLEDYDDEDEWANEHEASGEYPTGFDNPEELDDDFIC